jgi:hypothetical protein
MDTSCVTASLYLINLYMLLACRVGWHVISLMQVVTCPASK